MPQAPAPITRAQRYDATTIALHWTTAVLVAVLWVSAHAIGWFGHSQTAAMIRSSHVVLGVTLGVVLVARFAWRLGPGRALPAADRGALHVLAKATHYALYALLVATVLLGVANLLAHGGSIFGLVHVPKLDFSALVPPDRIRGWHALAANAILIVAGLHAAAALVHHYLWHDGVLGRMAPFLRR